MSMNEHVLLHGKQERVYHMLIVLLLSLLYHFNQQSIIIKYLIKNKVVIVLTLVAVAQTLKVQITSMKVIAKIIIKITTKTHMIVAIEVQDCRASAPTPGTTCEQGSNCTEQQSLSDRDRSTSAPGTTEQEDTPFVLSLPFP
jgi:hypothetical protein